MLRVAWRTVGTILERVVARHRAPIDWTKVTAIATGYGSDPEHSAGFRPGSHRWNASRCKNLAKLPGKGGAVDYAALEHLVAEKTAAIEVRSHQVLLEAIADTGRSATIGGVDHVGVVWPKGTYRTLAGPVSLWRWLPRPVGVRNGKTVDPVCLRTGAFGDGWLPATALAMAFDVQSATSREAAQGATMKRRLPYSRASFERVAHLVGESWVQHHADIEDHLIRDFKLPEKTHSVSAAIDRASVPIEAPLPRPRGRPRKGAPRRPVKRRWQVRGRQQRIHVQQAGLGRPQLVRPTRMGGD